MPISGLDHVAIPVQDIHRTVEFYRRLGFTVPQQHPSTATSFVSIQFGEHKINLHGPALWQDPESTLRGRTATPGCGDFCFVWENGRGTARCIGARDHRSRSVRLSGRVGARVALR